MQVNFLQFPGMPNAVSNNTTFVTAVGTSVDH
jgi:hypothetical protein